MIEQLQFPELVDIKGAATYLSTSIRHVRRLVQKTELDFVKIGGKLRFDKADLQRYVDDHRYPGKPNELARPQRARLGQVPIAHRPSGNTRLT